MNTQEKLQERIEQNAVDCQRIVTEGENLQKEMAELKPKLRAGDCTIHKQGSLYFHAYDKGANKIFPVGKDSSYPKQTSDEGFFKVYFNAFDDLEKLKKPLREFVGKDEDGAPFSVGIINSNKTIKFTINNDITKRADFNIAQAKDFSMKLRRVILAAEKKCQPTQ